MLKKIVAHKIISALAILIVLGGGYFVYKKFSRAQEAVRYATAEVVKGTFIASVSGTGQVSASNQIDLKPKVSGDIISISVKQGQEVKSGAVIAQIDASSALKAVRDAQVNLESAKLALQKLQQPVDSLSLLQAQNTLTAAGEAKIKAEDDLKKAYEDGFNTVADAFLDLPGILTGLDDILYSSTFNANQDNLYYYADQVKDDDYNVITYRDNADAAYKLARKNFDKSFLNYKATNRNSGEAAIEALTAETYETTRDIAEAVKSVNNLLDFYQDRLTDKGSSVPVQVGAFQSKLETYTGQTNSHLTSLLSVRNSIKNSKDQITAAERSIREKTESLAKLQAGTDVLDLKSQELTIRQRENALSDAKAGLVDYTVRAPFDGVIAKAIVARGDQVSAQTVIVQFITKQKLAEISLNEVDAARVKLGQKATLTFDALVSLELTGAVAEIDAIGTVASGVSNYNVKIGFDTQDESIKPGMSASAIIITDVKQDALLVPNSAVKTGGVLGAYIEVLENGQVRQVGVEAGEANDTLTEVSGELAPGSQVITQTITDTGSSAQTSTGRAGSGSLTPFGGGGGFRPR